MRCGLLRRIFRTICLEVICLVPFSAGMFWVAKLVGPDFLAGCSPRIGAGWQQKLLDLDISASGQFLLEVLVSNSDMPRIGSRGRWLG